ncbi:MAG: MMPL family transporter [Candidatus Altiarchaeota archaeon]
MSKEAFKRLMEAYGRFISAYPFIILAVALLFTVVAAGLQATLELVPMGDKDFLPADRPVVVALEKIEDEFGGLRTLTVVVEVDPTVSGSNEVRDNLDPRMVAYAWTLHEKIGTLKEVGAVTSGASLLKAGNGGTLPKSIDRARQLWSANPALNQYLSDDHSLLLIRAEILPDVDDEEVYNQLDSILANTKRPPGAATFMIGGIPENVELDRLIAPDMGRVMSMSFIGIVIVVFIIMGSLAYGVLPLFTIIFGTTWSMGMWAGLGRDLTHNTSGVSSMIMGIGIDFGIQTITRFRQEYAKDGRLDEALGETLANVVYPMSTTTIAALIGFRAMSMGELTPLADMASIMSLGVFGCFLAAVTVVPSVLVIYERYLRKFKLREVIRRWI